MTPLSLAAAAAQSEHAKSLALMRSALVNARFFTAAKAMEFAAGFHTDVRKDGVSPEFSHQIYLARYVRTILPGLMLPEETLATVFLHDLVEDYADQVPIDEIERRFGAVIAEATWRLTKVRNGLKLPNDIYYAGMVDDPIASLVKGVDRAHNIFTMSAARWTPAKQLDYLDEADHYLLPMMKRARRTFPEQEPAYHNVKTLLAVQAAHIRLHLGPQVGATPDAGGEPRPR